MFVGRAKELSLLKEKFDSNSIELGVIYGQRRIGKTSIILESVKQYNYIYFLSRDTNLQENLYYFTDVFRNSLDLQYTPSFKTFDELFDALFKTISNDTIIIIDELPFLAKVYPGIISFLQGIMDMAKQSNIVRKILLSGSDSSFMVDLLENKAKPLYQRATFKIHVTPMLFSDAIRMLEGFSPIDKVRYLSIFGNRPYYLDKLSKNKSFEKNLLSLCFNNKSILIDAPNITLPIGYSSNSTYVSILIALSKRQHKIKEIASFLNIDDKSLSTFLSRMLDAEAIDKRDVFSGNKRSVYYEISDPFIRFYYQLIYPYLRDIENDFGEEIIRSNMVTLSKIIEHGFEDVCNSYIHELSVSKKLPHVYKDIKKYNVDNSSLGRSIQIDGISESFDGKHLLVVEAKFRDKDISLEVLNHLKESVSIFKGYQSIDYFLISKKGFADNIKSLNDAHVHLISLDMMTNPKIY